MLKTQVPGMHRLTELEFLGMGPRNVHLINFCKVFLPTQKSENHSQRKTDNSTTHCAQLGRGVSHGGVTLRSCHISGSFVGRNREGSRFCDARSLVCWAVLRGEEKNLKN